MEIVISSLKEEGVIATHEADSKFNYLYVTGKRNATIARAMLYVCCYNVIFTQPLGGNKFEILFN